MVASFTIRLQAGLYTIFTTQVRLLLCGEINRSRHAGFREDALNIAPYLLHLKQKESGSYELIRDTVRLVAPFFDDFLLRPQTKGTNELVRLEWQQKGSDFPFQPNQLSDGTIRFICLATALLQPNPPTTIVIDEPELGLHPYAISLLSELVKSASERTQVIISTQSPTLLDYFEPDQIVVVNRHDGRSTFERLDAQRARRMDGGLFRWRALAEERRAGRPDA